MLSLHDMRERLIVGNGFKPFPTQQNFFTQIMEKIKKGYSLRIVLLGITILFFTNAVYAIGLSETYLRIPLIGNDSEEIDGRAGRTMHQVAQAETYGNVERTVVIPITFATPREIRDILGSERLRYYMVEGHMVIDEWLISGLYSTERVQMIINKKGLQPLMPEIVSRLKKFRYSPMVFKDYESMFKWLQQLAGIYDREVYGYIVRKKDKLLVSARLGYNQIAKVLNRKRQFHTHPLSGIADFSDGDIVAFLGTSSQIETIVASTNGVVIMRKKNVDTIKKLKPFIKTVFREYRQHLIQSTGTPMSFKNVRFADTPDEMVLTFYEEGVGFVIQKLSEKLTGSPHDIGRLISYLGIEKKIVNQDGEKGIIPANIHIDAITLLLDEFKKDPKGWVQKEITGYIPYDGITIEFEEVDEIIGDSMFTETDL